MGGALTTSSLRIDTLLQMVDSPSIQYVSPAYFFDTDAAGVVHNIAYLRYIEIARTKLGDIVGLKLTSMRPPAPGETALVPVIRRTEIDYLAPARLADTMVITATLCGFERVRFRASFTICSQADPSLIYVRCVQTLAILELPSGKPRRIPDAWRTHYPHLFKSPGADAN